MTTPACEQAIRDAQRTGSALLKFITPNDVGLTGSHQKGFYLPKAAWRVFSPFAPTKGTNHDHRADVLWQDGCVTQSTVKWYGKGTRFEYRLTGFNKRRDFPFISADCVGSLLVLIPEKVDRFAAYVLDLDEEIDDVQAGLGVEVVQGWAVYGRHAVQPPETEDECIHRHFRGFVAKLKDFPSGLVFATEARMALTNCVKDFIDAPSDEFLLRCVQAEYVLFRMAERMLCEPEIVRLFQSVDDFLAAAQTILQRRKSRAGKSLEHHVEYLLRQAGIPFDARCDVEGTKPDLLIPGRKEYLDPAFPVSRLFAVGIKTTCKDRWRQVLREAPRVTSKHILTVQQGISSAQLAEMRSSTITLVVPRRLHSDYPRDERKSILTVAGFVDQIRAALALP